MGQAGSSSHLLGSRASPGAKEVAALSRLRAEAPPSVALRGAVQLGELLAVVGALAPAPVLARLVAGGAVPLRLREVVHVDVLRPRPRDDLLPLDRLDVAEVVVVQDAHTALEDIWGWREDENDESGKEREEGVSGGGRV